MLKTIRQGEWFQIIIPNKWEGKTIADIFRSEWVAPKKITHLFRMKKKVRVDGRDANWDLPLVPGSRLQLNLFEEEQIHLTPNTQEIDILYEDDHVMIINKPPFINTHPNDPIADNNTLANAAQFHLISQGEMRNIRQIHRLDRDTSGAILFAKHALAGAICDQRLVNRGIKRTYLAVVHGLFSKKKGIIRAPIGRDRHHPTKRRVSSTGLEAITHYQVIDENRNTKLSYIKCQLETGRTHQIRVHFSHIGHPLAGDVLYGGKAICKRQALHASKLELIHPFTEEKIECFAPFLDEPELFKAIDIHSL